MEVLGKLLTSSKCIAPQPWLTRPAPDDINKEYGSFGGDPHDEERQNNWIACRKRRALELLPIALLVAAIILLLAPKRLEPYIDDLAYGIAGISIISYLTAGYRAKTEYQIYAYERETTGLNHKDYVSFKKRNFSPGLWEYI